MELARQLLAVAGVFALLGAAVWALRRNGSFGISAAPGRRSHRRMEPVERLALSPQHSVHLVRVAGKLLLIAAFPGGCSVLDTLPPEPLEPDPGSMRR